MKSGDLYESWTIQVNPEFEGMTHEQRKEFSDNLSGEEIGKRTKNLLSIMNEHYKKNPSDSDGELLTRCKMLSFVLLEKINHVSKSMDGM